MCRGLHEEDLYSTHLPRTVVLMTDRVGGRSGQTACPKLNWSPSPPGLSWSVMSRLTSLDEGSYTLVGAVGFLSFCIWERRRRRSEPGHGVEGTRHDIAHRLTRRRRGLLRSRDRTGAASACTARQPRRPERAAPGWGASRSAKIRGSTSHSATAALRRACPARAPIPGSARWPWPSSTALARCSIRRCISTASSSRVRLVHLALDQED